MSRFVAVVLTLFVVTLHGCASGRDAESTVVPATQAPPSAAVAAPPVAAPSQLANTVRWSTASEVDNFGYDVYRADSAEGPWVRLNARPLLGAGTTDEVQRYSYVDSTIEAGRPYFYYVESISLAGVRERFTPIIEAPPKQLPPPPATPP